MNQQNLKSSVVPAAAFAWGLLTLMPVSMNYLCLLGLVLATTVQASWRARWQRLSERGIALALMMFAAWTVMVLIAQDTWYDRTASNLWHGFRICLTIGLAASLDWLEARQALLGFWVSAVCAMALAIGSNLGVIPILPFWEHLSMAGTNKTIGASIVLTIFFAVLLARAAYTQGKNRWLYALATLPILWVIVGVMSKRTAILGILIAAAVVVLHRSRAHKRVWVLLVAVTSLLVFLVWSLSPSLQAQFGQGVREIQDALNGQVKVESWNVRIQMIEHTFAMMLERPWFGWGIGAWNHQWALRVPVEIAGFNMPHNDFLWMGAQGGLLGGLLWLVLMTSGVRMVWRAPTWCGAAAVAAILVSTFSALVNNATRDATIGLPMLWIMGVLISLASYSEDLQPRFEK